HEVRPPPATGPYAYNAFVPPGTTGFSYVDPVFGETVRRLTTDHVRDDLYARNMWWNADETLYLHLAAGDGGESAPVWNVIDVAGGAVTHRGIPIGMIAGDGGFDPKDPAILYYYGRDGIHRVRLAPGGRWRDRLYWTPPEGAALRPLGGTLNWLDAAGRFMLVRYGPEPSVRLYDRRAMDRGPYANPIDGSRYIDTGSYIGVSPDGRYLVGYDSSPGAGVYGMGQAVSWELDHAAREIAAAPRVFWSLCGDHGSLISASDGRDYMIVNACHTRPGLWRVAVGNDARGLDEAEQQALPNNRLLLAYATWNDASHVATAAWGDWAFVSTEDRTDAFDSGTSGAGGDITPWHAYRQEILALDVITGEIRRLAHHRSRFHPGCGQPGGPPCDYASTPRVSAGWSGRIVGFASNFNQSGADGTPVVDVYAIPFVRKPPGRWPRRDGS
ncbi:MAG: hypothetical protein ACRD5D_03425, partial [Candidatus Polarisedimenticolia bacterium]